MRKLLLVVIPFRRLIAASTKICIPSAGFSEAMTFRAIGDVGLTREDQMGQISSNLLVPNKVSNYF